MLISIIGTGNMAKAIATRALAGGHAVELHTRHIEEGSTIANELGQNAAAVEIGSALGDIVVLATPYDAVSDIAGHYDQFVDKTVVDITNPIDFNTFQLIPAAGTSGAEEVAKLIPDAHVVKAFNTTLAGPLTAGTAGDLPLDVFIAGDDADAKASIAQLVRDGGLRPIDVGALANARHLEGFQLLHMAAQEQLGTGWMSAITIVK
jgi:predicted dinucleotide-binding enzyme